MKVLPDETPPTNPRDATNAFMMKHFRITIPPHIVPEPKSKQNEMEMPAAPAYLGMDKSKLNQAKKPVQSKLQKYVNNAVSTFFEKNNTDILVREPLLCEKDRLLKAEVEAWPKYVADLAAYNTRLCERSRINAARARALAMIARRRRNIERLQDASRKWYREGISEFKKDLAERNQKRLPGEPHISGFRKSGRFDLGERFYRDPFEDPFCHH
jgi:hypothetical protein